MEQQADGERARPYAGWSSVGFGLVALAFGLWVLLRGDVVDNLLHPAKDDPLLMVALVNGILGTLAGIVALARRESTRLAILGLVVSLVAVLAKFFLVALLVAVVLFVVVGLLGGIG
ncbi:hypothetical protein [Paraliomyxa miuraensis]|uniref:hypothetical protein n=1 Tax=Paraliomyxa miuraensis TaxID=376150 RepID=UPI0022531F13|nr:hypothetical protein [Paraliomyxa miuraensis]MCX4243830.1 hypothetical protein [Paraliomyxa miuraensis]